MKLYINFLSTIAKLSDYIKGRNSACIIQTFKLLRDEGVNTINHLNYVMHVHSTGFHCVVKQYLKKHGVTCENIFGLD